MNESHADKESRLPTLTLRVEQTQHALQQLEDPRAPDLLAELATRPTPNPYSMHRVAAARMLTDLDDPRGVQLLVDLTGDPACAGEVRVTAAHGLLHENRALGTAILEELAGGGSDLSDAARVMAAGNLAIYDHRGLDLLAALVEDVRIGASQRGTAAWWLRKVGDERGPALLARLANDPEVPSYVRRWVRDRL